MRAACAVWIYGSHARGDVDSLSDLDLLVVTSSSDAADLSPIAHLLKGASISRYTWSELRSMAAYGSLFLHHVRLEGRPLYESADTIGRMRQILDRMPDYQLGPRDIQGFRTVLTDVEDALEGGGTEAYELSVLGTVIRHCSILGCWLVRKPRFGRTEPVVELVSSLDLDERIAKQFPELYKYRLYMDDRVEKPTSPLLSVRDWKLRAATVIDAVEATL